jgi:hypothetical protein
MPISATLVRAIRISAGYPFDGPVARSQPLYFTAASSPLEGDHADAIQPMARSLHENAGYRPVAAARALDLPSDRRQAE